MPTLSTGAAGVPATNKVPAIFLSVTLGAGANTAGGATREVLLWGYKLAAGTATVDTQINLVTSQTDAEAYWGKGSELALMWEFAAAAAPGATLRGIAITEPAGVKASGTVTVVGAATATGTYSLWVHGVLIQVTVTNGDAIATIASNIAAAINGSAGKLKTLMVTASPAAGVVTITCRHNGVRGNLITLRQSVDTAITGSAFTLSGALLTGGTLTDSLSASLLTASTQVYKYYAVPHADTTSLQSFQTQMIAMSGALSGKRQYTLFGSRDTLGTMTTQVQTLNENRMQVLWNKNSETLPGFMAASWAAVRSVGESLKISTNWDGNDMFPFILSPPAESDWPDLPTQAAALNVGATPIGVAPVTKHAYVVRSITSHSLVSGSTNPDTRTLDTTKVVVPDYFADTLSGELPTAFPNLNLVDDPVDATADELPPGTTTPGRIKSYCVGVLRRLEKEGHVTNVDNDVKAWAFNLAPTSPGRVNATMPMTVVDGLHQISGDVRQQG